MGHENEGPLCHMRCGRAEEDGDKMRDGSAGHKERENRVPD